MSYIGLCLCVLCDLCGSFSSAIEGCSTEKSVEQVRRAHDWTLDVGCWMFDVGPLRPSVLTLLIFGFEISPLRAGPGRRRLEFLVNPGLQRAQRAQPMI